MHTRLYTCVTRSHRCVRCGGDNIHIECYTHSALVNCSNKYETRSIRHLFIGHEILLQLFASKNCSNAALFGKQYNTRIVHWKLPLAKCNWSTHWNKELAFQWSAPFHTIVFCAIVMPCMSSLAKHSIIDHFSKVTMNRGAIIQWRNNKLSSSIHSASHTYICRITHPNMQLRMPTRPQHVGTRNTLLFSQSTKRTTTRFIRRNKGGNDHEKWVNFDDLGVSHRHQIASSDGRQKKNKETEIFSDLFLIVCKRTLQAMNSTQHSHTYIYGTIM